MAGNEPPERSSCFLGFPLVRVECSVAHFKLTALIRQTAEQEGRKDGRQVRVVSWYVCAAQTRHCFSFNNAAKPPLPSPFFTATSEKHCCNSNAAMEEQTRKKRVPLVFLAAFRAAQSSHTGCSLYRTTILHVI